MKRYRVEIEAVMYDGVTKSYVNAAMPAISMLRAFNKSQELAIRELTDAGHAIRALSSVKLEVVDWGE